MIYTDLEDVCMLFLLTVQWFFMLALTENEFLHFFLLNQACIP